jgi:hypothetical protein
MYGALTSASYLLGGKGANTAQSQQVSGSGNGYQFPRLGSTLDNQNGVYYAPQADNSNDNLDNSFNPFSNRRYGKI